MRRELSELYEHRIRQLPAADRLSLLAAIARDLAEASSETTGPHSLLELEGLGADIWRGVDAQAYVNALREEWDQRP
jgi:hypothetical protein